MGKQFDAVVIGSGISGLTCGAFLARSGMRVCVLEKHTKIGGYAHSFNRGIYCFESGIHSVPLAPDGFIFHLLRLLGVESSVTAERLDTMYGFTCENESYCMPARLDDIVARLRSDFPSQRSNITALFDDMRKFYETLIVPLFHFEERFTERNQAFISQYLGRSYRDHIERFITDPRLIRIFCSQWPFWGMPPEMSPTIFCLLAFYMHSFEGSHYVVGGFSRLADALALAITRRGGEIRTGVEATDLEIENRFVRSVCTACNEQFEADLFVSNISPYMLFQKMIPQQWRNKIWLRRLNMLRPSVSAVALYCGLRHQHDFPGGSAIYFTFDDADYSGLYRSLDCTDEKWPNHLIFLQTLQPGKAPTMLVFSFCRADDKTDWKSLKPRCAQRLAAAAEKYIPGFMDAVEIMEIASPATFERFSGNTAGALYGFENTKEIYGETKMPNTTYLRNLFQTGHWCKPGGGVWNVMESGYTAAQIILKRGVAGK